MKSYHFLIGLLILQLSEPGCSGSKDNIMRGSTPSGEITKSTMNLNFYCDKNSNNNNAVLIRIFQLKNAEKFRSISPESLGKNPEEVLTGDIIPDTKFEKMLVPGEFFLKKDLEIKKDAEFLGVTGDFYSPSANRWQQIIPVESGKSEYDIYIHENSITYKNIK